jgi:hypothetical protein
VSYLQDQKIYSFFFDESSHDRKVTNTEKGINIYMDGNNDLFVGVLWGLNSQVEDEYRSKYLNFESFGKKFLAYPKIKS